MNLSSVTAIRRISPDNSDPNLKYAFNTERCRDVDVHKVISITSKFLTKFEARGCLKLTDECFARLGEIQFLRGLDLLSCRVSDNGLKSLSTSIYLSSISLRYCSHVKDIGMISKLPALTYLDVGNCTELANIDGLVDHPSLETLYVDGSTQISSITSVIDSAPNLKYLNCGFTKVLKPTNIGNDKALFYKEKSRSHLFFDTILNGNPEAKKKLNDFIDAGQDINERIPEFWHDSTSSKFYMDILKQSFRFFNVDCQNAHIRPTALHLALYTGDIGVIKLLLGLGANRNLRCWFGKLKPAYNCTFTDIDSASCSDIIKCCQVENIWRRVLKWDILIDWKERCLDRRHAVECAFEGADPNVKERPVYD